MKKKISEFILTLAVFLLVVILILKFAGPTILRLYIENGIGDCKSIPILCMAPAQTVIKADIDKEQIPGFIPYKFKHLEVFIPKGFNVVQETIKKFYYKRNKRRTNAPVIYLLYKEPGFFVRLFANLKKHGISNNYDFIRRLMHSRIDQLNNIHDAFFIIMKGIFTPDLGNQRSVSMGEFAIGAHRAFINYNINSQDNYFDCNVIDAQGGFFKIYIRDIGAKLDLHKVFSIISTLNTTSYPGN